MGRMKEQWMDGQSDRFEAKRYAKLAERLGLTEDELEQLNPTIEVESTDDGVDTGLLVQFSTDAPQDILKKIDRDGKNYIHMGLNDLDVDDYNELEEDDEPIFQDFNPQAVKALADSMQIDDDKKEK